jgi:hypothetical protein
VVDSMFKRLSITYPNQPPRQLALPPLLWRGISISRNSK